MFLSASRQFCLSSNSLFFSMRMASCGQPVAHTPQPRHMVAWMKGVAGSISFFIFCWEMAPNGQRRTQRPQPLHGSVISVAK